MENICLDCKIKDKIEDGICPEKMALDGYAIRCVGDWSIAKHHYLKRCVHMFTQGMKDKWEGELYYLDFFSGPGKCRERKTEQRLMVHH